MRGLAPNTNKIFESISNLDCIKSYVLVGGTALSLQLATRESEDLDFMSWRKNKNDKREIDWPIIRKELESIGNVEKIDILDFDHVEFVLDGVKISFYISPNSSPLSQEICWLNNLRVADKVAIGAMKMEVLLRRSKFRDYYDIYSLIEDGVSIHDMINAALKYSGHKLKSKNLMAMLTRSERFMFDLDLTHLNPIYSVTPKDIEERIKLALKS